MDQVEKMTKLMNFNLKFGDIGLKKKKFGDLHTEAS